MADQSHSFISYYKRATSPLVVLLLLQERPMYGYEITAEIAKRSGGRYTVSVLYPILTGLVEDGYIEEEEKVIVDTRFGYRTCTKIDQRGIAENVYRLIDADSVFLQLAVGSNNFQSAVLAGLPSDIAVTIEFDAQYFAV